MEWITIKEFSDIDKHFQKNNVLTDYILFKHSTRCGTSSMAKKVFEKAWNNQIPVFLIHVIEDRPLSNFIEQHFRVKHESPQLLLIQNDKCIYQKTHSDIDANELTAYIQSK